MNEERTIYYKTVYKEYGAVTAEGTDNFIHMLIADMLDEEIKDVTLITKEEFTASVGEVEGIA